MSFKRRLLTLAAGAAMVPAVLVAIPAGTASAHGYVSSPASRQAQCAQNTVSCGSIKWEPQSVEGPKGLMSCNGGVGRFADLNDDSKGWKVHSLGRTTTFRWTLTARHRTSTWEYFVDGAKVASINDNGAQPGATVTHSVNLQQSGRHKILARWNVYDTANAFYACIDANIS
ncbi:lytic polysaccharide monooxygenase [Amycolatopsis oliviviridis]|uniref:Chitin-binding protein n=1 Tax=Amycolatopsis oliviviridis TaxID=1471590 RepID=A0ABQ3M949_9PSEU|nr:lytic polysaccharide monooxygenase auxiliary activity family 9 protein [Amycolatopsis oliviviridis]GHH36234.1 chitin-binding protein [Amycolatopsis oliviviridis]